MANAVQRLRVLGAGFWREVAVVASGMLLYDGTRALSKADYSVALRHARDLVRLENQLGINVEGAVQRFALHHPLLRDLADWIYVYGHWPVLLAVGIGLFIWRRPQYRTFRNAFAISGLIGFAFFALDPTAPPRLAHLGLQDTVAQLSSGYSVLQPARLTNQYASMPSLHFGWDLLAAIFVVRYARPLPIRVIACVMPVAMFFAVVATANHFVVDPVVGGAVVLVSLAAADLLGRRARARRAASVQESSRSRNAQAVRATVRG